MKYKLKALLKPERYIHSIGVCEEAVKMAHAYGVDADKAYTAGLLHDCAKGYDIMTQIKLCKDYGLDLDEITMSCPAVIHAPLGAEIAYRDFNISDIEILNAIRFHTVARKGMAKLDKIIYVADMTERNRRFDGVEELRKIAYDNLNAVFVAALRQSMEFNLNKQSIIHPKTLEAWNDILMTERK